MKITAFMLKVAALVLACAAVLCLVLAHMDKLSDYLACFLAKVQEKKELLCSRMEVSDDDDEFEPWKGHDF